MPVYTSEMIWAIVIVVPFGFMMLYMHLFRRRGFAARLVLPLVFMALCAGFACLRIAGILIMPWDDPTGFFGGGTGVVLGVIDIIACISAFAGFALYWLPIGIKKQYTAHIHRRNGERTDRKSEKPL